MSTGEVDGEACTRIHTPIPAPIPACIPTPSRAAAKGEISNYSETFFNRTALLPVKSRLGNVCIKESLLQSNVPFDTYRRSQHDRLEGSFADEKGGDK